MQKVDDSLELVLGADRNVHGDALVGELGTKRLEHAVEVGALAVEHVHEDDPREPALLGALPVPRGLDLDAHHGAHGEERTLDDAQRRDGVALKAGVARRVDQVDLAALPLHVADRRGERHLAPLLVVVPVADGRAGLDGAEPIRGAGLEEQRLDERRLPRPAMTDDGDVADLPRLEWHALALCATRWPRIDAWRRGL